MFKEIINLLHISANMEANAFLSLILHQASISLASGKKLSLASFLHKLICFLPLLSLFFF